MTQPKTPNSDENERLWVPDNPDGSGWANVDWHSTIQGSRYAYRHAEADVDASKHLPPFYKIVTRLDTPNLHAPHENTYFVPGESLSEFVAELTLAGGDETLWHIEPCECPPQEAFANPRE